MGFQLKKRNRGTGIVGKLDRVFNVLVDVSEITPGMAEIVKRVLKILQGVIEIASGMGAILVGMIFVLVRVLGLRASRVPIGEGVLKIMDEVIEILKRMGAVVFGMLEVGHGVGKVMRRVLVVLNGVVHYGGSFRIVFEELLDRSTHKMLSPGLVMLAFRG